MNPWITGRIVEQMQIEARATARRDHVQRDAVAERRPLAPEATEPRRERVGLAVARLGLRIAGRKPEPAVLRRAFTAPKLEASR